MFSPKVVDTDLFLDMSTSAQNLYFHLGLRADDDGLVGNPKKIMKICNASSDDMKVLISKNFIIPFDSGIVVITSWHINNLVRKDWYRETQYKDEKSQLNLHNQKYFVNESLTTREHRLGNLRLGNNNIILHSEQVADKKESKTTENGKDVNEIIDLFKEVNPSYSRLFKNKTERSAVERLIKQYGRSKLEEIIKFLPKNNDTEYATVIISPYELETKMGKLIAFWKKQNNSIPIL